MSLVTVIELISEPTADSYLKELDIQMHDYLTDDADWDARYWDFDGEYLIGYAKLIESIYLNSINGIEFQALWAGESPKTVLELSIEAFLKIIKSNRISTVTRYIVRKHAKK